MGATIKICHICKKYVEGQVPYPGASYVMAGPCERCQRDLRKITTYDRYIHDYPEQEAAVQYLVNHWREYRVEARRLRRFSLALTDIYDACMGIRTTYFGPGAAFKVQGQPYDLEHMVILVPQQAGKTREWFDANHEYASLGALVKISAADKK